MFYKNLKEILRLLNIGFKKKKAWVICKNLKKMYSFLTFLEKEGIIRGYVISKTHIKIFLKCNTQPDIKTYSWKTKKHCITKHALKRLVNKTPGSVFFLHTRKGIVSHRFALKTNEFGVLLCKFLY